MKLLADVHISPHTVEVLQSLGHDIIRVNTILPNNATDEAIVAKALEDNRSILTQDLDFSTIIALSGRTFPSLISLRLASSRVENVNAVLQRVLPSLEHPVIEGAIATVEDERVRIRRLPMNG